MNGGILHAAAAMDLLGKAQDTRAQNLANANTVGYRKRIGSAQAFASALRRAAGMTLPNFRENVDFSPGNLRHTGANLDLGIKGNGFFAVETGRGMRFTRNGNFTSDKDGFLVTTDGARVAGENGPIQIDPTQGPVTVDERGQVKQNSEDLGRLRVVEFRNQNRLVPAANGRFREGPGNSPVDATKSTVRQGYLENSNVNVVDELVQMISGMRAFQAAQKALQGIDRVRGQGISAGR